MRLTASLCLTLLLPAGCATTSPRHARPTHPRPAPTAALDESAVAQPADAEAEPAPVAETAPAAPTAYTPAAPYTAAERAARFPRGDLAGARARNRAGLAKRQAGDHAGARADYEAALGLAPRYAPARYNRACELALGATPEAQAEALAELETLLRLGTKDARLFVARARLEPDFDGVRADPRFVGVVARVAFDAQAPFEDVLCTDPGRVGSLIDPTRGLALYWETESADESIPEIHRDEHVTGKAAYDVALQLLGRAAVFACDPEMREDYPGSLVSGRLARATGPTRCLSVALEFEWGSYTKACFVKTDAGWRLSSLAEWPAGPLDPNFAWTLKKAANAAKARGFALFGVTPAK